MKIDLPKKCRGKVVEKKQLSPKVVGVKIETEEPLEYQAGQYASWLIEDERRLFSYAAPANGKEAYFLVDTSPGGVASKFVQKLAVGDGVEWLSPYGFFTVEDGADSPLLFIATGTGVAPLRAHILDLLAKNTKRAMTLVFGISEIEHLFLQEEWDELKKKHKNFKVITVCENGHDGWPGETGMVTEVVPRVIKDLPRHSIYICGNPNMLIEMVAVLRENGVSDEQIHTEGYT